MQWTSAEHSLIYAAPDPTWLQSRLASCGHCCCCSKALHSKSSHVYEVLYEKVFALATGEDVAEMILPVPRNESELCCHIDCLERTLLPQESWTDRGALPGNNWPQCILAWIVVVHLGYSAGFQQSLVVWIRGGLIASIGHWQALHLLGSQTDQTGRL